MVDKKQDKKKFTFETTIKSCDECICFDDASHPETYCEHEKFPRQQPNNQYIDLSDSIDPYETIHPDCPGLKGKW